MKRTLYFVMVLALVLGFTQCKKEQVNTPGNETKTVNISLKVGGHGGSRHTINTENGDVDFQDGDVIYVGNGSTYIGTLTRNGGVFSGLINEPADETEIYFYFVGGLTPSATPEAGTTSSFTVDISDQRNKMPVLSCNSVTYQTGTQHYSCVLQNQCALVKFTTASTTDPVHVGGLYTEAMIDFDNNSITNNGTTGFVNLHPDAEDNEAKWAVLLPQTGFNNAEAAVAHVGYTTTIRAIEADGFITGENAISISTPSNIVYLDWLTTDYTATDGQTLKGTLNAVNNEAQRVKISIAADATVTLNNATITGTNSDSYQWAGINCENNATIILEGTNNVTGFHEDYPGIHIASGKTLTIQGSGTLYASSNGGVNGWGAGIGGSSLVDCGNIVINSGTINATGGTWMAGIGGGFGKNCGSITINGGTVTATGGRGAAGIGSGKNCGSITINGGTVTATGGGGAAGIGTGVGQQEVIITCVDISITGGIVNATGGRGAAGIGSGFVTFNGKHNTCGNISITGGQVTATGGDGGDHVYPDIINNTSWANFTYYGGAGIGTGSTANRYGANVGSSSCGTITIGSGVTRVTATKGGGTRPATNSIGKNESSYNYGTCGTINIGGTVYPDGATPNQTDGLTFVYPAPAPVIPEGAVNGLFSVSSTKQVYFSKGSLQYIGSASTPYWKFADNQWDLLSTTNQNTNNTNVDRDIFSWGTSGYPHGANIYQPWGHGTDNNQFYAYGDIANYLSASTGKADWGYNAISNGGNQEHLWYTLDKDEWTYLLINRPGSTVNGTDNARYARATVEGINGVILFPDIYTHPADVNQPNYINSNSGGWANTYTAADFMKMEAHGAVFLPAGGGYVGGNIVNRNAAVFYWSSQPDNNGNALGLYLSNNSINCANSMYRHLGIGVRLVKDAE